MNISCEMNDISYQEILSKLISLYDKGYHEIDDNTFLSCMYKHINKIIDDFEDVAQFSDWEVELATEIIIIGQKILESDSNQIQLIINFFRNVVKLLYPE